MNYCCGNCKYAEYNRDYLYPFKCKKEKAKRYSDDEYTRRIVNGYKCDEYENTFEVKE